MLTGYLATLPDDALLDSGVLFVGNTPLGSTDGAPRFDPKRSVRQIARDGAHAPVVGLDRVMHDEPVISCTLIEFGGSATGDQIAALEPGSVEGAEVSGVTTITPQAAGELVDAGSYLDDLRLVFERSGGGYAAIYFPHALCNRWSLAGANKAEGRIEAEFVGRVAASTAADLKKAAYLIELRDALPA